MGVSLSTAPDGDYRLALPPFRRLGVSDAAGITDTSSRAAAGQKAGTAHLWAPLRCHRVMGMISRELSQRTLAFSHRRPSLPHILSDNRINDIAEEEGV